MSDIYLYRYNCDRKKIVKHAPDDLKTSFLSEISKITETFRIKEPSSIINPVVTVSKSSVGKDWASVNYAYIPMFKRYYFVDNITCLHDNLLQLDMHVDVLQSYYSQLLNTTFEIARSESINSEYYIDTEKALLQRRIVTYKKIGSITQSAANTKKYFITVAGG